jgi:hypothetical protein
MYASTGVKSGSPILRCGLKSIRAIPTNTKWTPEMLARVKNALLDFKFKAAEKSGDPDLRQAGERRE